MATFSESTVGKDINIDLADLCYCSDCQKHKIHQRAEFYCKKCLKFYCAKCVIKHGKKFKKHKTYGTEYKKMWPFPEKEFQDVLLKHGLHEDLCKDLGTLCDRKCAEVSVQGDSDQVFSVLGMSGDSNQVFDVLGMSEYDVSLPSDSKKMCIIAICVLSDDEILVADYNNRRVKLLNHQYQVVGHCDLNMGWGPWDMCKISPSEVAVVYDTYWNEAEVHFVSVNGWVKGRKLQFQHSCFGIAHNQGDLYVTSGHALYKYSMSGDLLKKLYEDTTIDYLQVYKCAVSPSGDRIFVTNYSFHKVLTLARDGTVLHTFTDPDLELSHGIHVTDLGQVLVCDRGGSLNIIQLDTEGKKKLATIATGRDRHQFPTSVSFNRSTASIIVGQPLSNTILVFKEK